MTTKQGRLSDAEQEIEVAGESTEMVTREAAPLALNADRFERMVGAAIEKGADGAEAVKILMECQLQLADRDAAQQFNAALAEFQTECPEIECNHTRKDMLRAGAKVAYPYADITQCVRIAGPFLQKHGFSWTWDSVESGGKMRTSCTLRHIGGHAETAAHTCPTQSNAGMSEQQKYGSAEKFGMRRSFVMVTGVTTAEPDTDGADPTTITESQAADLQALIEGRWEGDARRKAIARFLKYMGVAEIDKILASDWRKANEALKR